MTNLIASVLLFFLTTLSFGQINYFEKKGQEFLIKAEYDSALVSFRQCSDSLLTCKYHLAVCYAYLKKYRPAINEYKKIELIYNGDIRFKSLYYDLGLCYNELNKYDSTIYYLKKQATLYPDFFTYYMLGHSYMKVNADSSLRYFKLAEGLNPTDPDLIYAQTKMNILKPDYSEALKYSTKLLDHKPSYIELNSIHYLRGQIFLFLNQLKESVNEWNIAASLGYKLTKKDLRQKRKREKKLKKTAHSVGL